jgi:hypothetical protein
VLLINKEDIIMKEKYTKPVSEIDEFEPVEILTTSTNGPGNQNEQIITPDEP